MSEAAAAYVRSMGSDKRSQMRSSIASRGDSQPSWSPAENVPASGSVAEAWASDGAWTSDPRQQQRARANMAVNRHSMSGGSPNSRGPPAGVSGWSVPGGSGGGKPGGWSRWSVPAGAMAVGPGRTTSAPASEAGQQSPTTSTAQRPPVYRAENAKPATAAGGPRRSLEYGAMDPNVSSKTGRSPGGWGANNVLMSPREAQTAPARGQNQRAKSRSSSRPGAGTKPPRAARAARARVASHVNSIITPNNPLTTASVEAEEKERARMRHRVPSAGKRPVSGGRHLTPAVHSSGGGVSLLGDIGSLEASYQQIKNRQMMAAASAASAAVSTVVEAPRCPKHGDCKLLPGHDGFCRLSGAREPPAAAAPGFLAAAAAAAGAAPSASAAASPVTPPRPDPEAAAAAVEQAETWEQQMESWGAEAQASTEHAVDRKTAPARKPKQKKGRKQKGAPPGSSWAPKGANETIDPSASSKSGRAPGGWTAVTSAGSKPAGAGGDSAALGSPQPAARKKLVRPASGRNWLAARRTAATNAGKADLEDLPPERKPAAASKASKTRGPRAAVDYARAAQVAIANATDAEDRSTPTKQPNRPSTAASTVPSAGSSYLRERRLSSKNKAPLRTAVMAATLGNQSSLSLDDQLKKRIEEKFRRDKPDIPMAVWLLRALQRTRAEACASNIIPARCMQDIPGVLHIPSGLMPELVERFSPNGSTPTDLSHAMVDYRKVVTALFPPLLGLHAPNEDPIGEVKTDGDEALTYMDYSAVRSRVRSQVGSNRSRLIDVFRVAMDAFGGRRLSLKSLQFAFSMLRIHMTTAAIRHHFGPHISGGVVGGHAVAGQLLDKVTKKDKRAAQRTNGLSGASQEDQRAGSPADSVGSVEDEAAQKVAAIVAAAREKSSKRGQVERTSAIAHAKVVREEQTAAKILAAEEVSNLLGKYHTLGIDLSVGQQSPGHSGQIGALIQAGAPDSYTKELERAAKSARGQTVGADKQAPIAGGGGGSGGGGAPATMQARGGGASGAAAASVGSARSNKHPFVTVDLEQAWADQVSYRFGLAWSMKHDHSVVNPTMMEGVADSAIHALWEHSSKSRPAARTMFTSDMLVRPEVSPARGVTGGSALTKLEMQVAKPSHTEGKPMDLSDVMAMVSNASSKGNSWAYKHSNPDGEWAERMAEFELLPDAELPDFLKHDDRDFTRLELARRPLVPAVPQHALTPRSILRRQGSTDNGSGSEKGGGKGDFSDESESESEDEASFDNLLPTRGDGAKSNRYASSASSSDSDSESDGPRETPKLDDVGNGFDEGMDEWEQQMTQAKENQSQEAKGLFGEYMYSSSDLSAEGFDEEELLTPKAVATGSTESNPGPGDDEINSLMMKAQESVEGLREIEQLADEQKWVTSPLASAVIAGLDNGTAHATAAETQATVAVDLAGARDSSEEEEEEDDEEEGIYSEDQNKTFSMMRLDMHPAAMARNTFQINGKIVTLDSPTSTTVPGLENEHGESARASPQAPQKRFVRPASAPMRTKRWVERDLKQHLDPLTQGKEKENHEDESDGEADLADDVLLGSLWLTQGEEAVPAASGHLRNAAKEQTKNVEAIKQAGAAALASQQKLWEELQDVPTEEEEASAAVAKAVAENMAFENTAFEDTPTIKEPKKRLPVMAMPKVQPGHRLQLLDLILFSDKIRAAILDALPWTELRRCRQLSKQMALICCEAVSHRPQIAVIGGNSGLTPTAKVTAFDLPTASWRRLPNLEKARSNAAVCTMMDGRLVVAGGFDSEGVHDSAEVFDPVCGNWTTLPPMSTARSGCRACPTLDNTLDNTVGCIVMGGYDADLVTVASVECYEALTNTWKAFPPLSSARYDFSACVLPRTGHLQHQRERIVVAGGTADTSAWLKTAEVFDGNIWSVLPVMSMQRDRCGACVLPGGKFAVLGGSITKGDSTEVKVHNLKTCETYDIAANEWSEMPPMHAARCNFGAVAVEQLDGCVAVLGGEGGAGSRAGATAEVYHPRTKKWTMLTAMNEPRAGCGAAVLSVATWRSEIEEELVETQMIAKIRARVSRPQKLDQNPVRFYKDEKSAKAALYGLVSKEMGACLAKDMVIGKRYVTGQPSGKRGEGPPVLVSVTRMGGVELVFGNGMTAAIGK